MGAAFPRHPTRAQPHEGNCKRTRSSLHGCLVQQTKSPFTAGVLHFPLPAKFRMPQIEMFDGRRDPVDHLNTYKNQMELHRYQDPVKCRTFAIMLKGLTLAWFNKLPPSSISSFRELSIAFDSHFIGARTYRKQNYHLLTIKQSR